jgi:hypothetical protein
MIKEGDWVEVMAGRFKGIIGFVIEVGMYSTKVVLTKDRYTGNLVKYTEYGEWIAKKDVISMDVDPETLTDCVDLTLDSKDAVWFYDLTDRRKGDSGWKANS